MASQADQRRLTADEFLRIIFASDSKFELDGGVVRMMTGGNFAHARVSGTLLTWLRNRLRGSGCRPLGPDMAVRTSEQSVRYPDVVVDCSATPPTDGALELSDPRVIIEVLSPGTRDDDKGKKLDEYRGLASADTIALIDPMVPAVHVLQRRSDGLWPDIIGVEPGNLHLPSLGLTMPRAEIFARD